MILYFGLENEINKTIKAISDKKIILSDDFSNDTKLYDFIKKTKKIMGNVKFRYLELKKDKKEQKKLIEHIKKDLPNDIKIKSGLNDFKMT